MDKFTGDPDDFDFGDDFHSDISESTLRAAVTGAIESVETTGESLPELAIEPEHEQEKQTP